MTSAAISACNTAQAQFERQGNIVDDAAPGEGAFLLKHHADSGMRASDLRACHGDASLIVVGQCADDVKQCGLAAAGWTDQRNEFVLRHVERKILDRRDGCVTTAEAFGDMFHGEGGDAHAVSDAMRLVRGRMEQLLRRQ
jgi:hypothetical protein